MPTSNVTPRELEARTWEDDNRSLSTVGYKTVYRMTMRERSPNRPSQNVFIHLHDYSLLIQHVLNIY